MYPKLEPGISQGTWETRASIPSGTHRPSLVWVNKEHIPTDHFWEVFGPNSLQEQRRQTRNKYSKGNWPDSFKTLQELSLQAYSSSRNRTIDSIELVIKLDPQQDLYHRVILDDSRGAPIRYNTLEPYSIQELEEYISSTYLDWYKAGGYFYYKYPTFWIDLWTIVQKENPAIIEWYLPEVVEEGIQATQEEGEVLEDK